MDIDKDATLGRPESHTLVFLGTGAACGVPSFYCGCVACDEARENPRARRGCSGVLVRGAQNTLIDTPPDLRAQLVRERIDHVDSLLYTHNHYDHVGGLGELEFFMRLRRFILPTWGSAPTVEYISAAYSFMEDCLDLGKIEVFETVELDDIHYTALPATHAPGTYGYLMESAAGTRVAYFPDTGKFAPEVAERIQGADALILDATFWKRSWSEQHHTVQEAVAERERLCVKELYLTHLSMHYDEPVTLAELEKYLEGFGGHVHVAYDGMEIAF